MELGRTVSCNAEIADAEREGVARVSVMIMGQSRFRLSGNARKGREVRGADDGRGQSSPGPASDRRHAPAFEAGLVLMPTLSGAPICARISIIGLEWDDAERDDQRVNACHLRRPFRWNTPNWQRGDITIGDLQCLATEGESLK